jgi:hypothetical protein
LPVLLSKQLNGNEFFTAKSTLNTGKTAYFNSADDILVSLFDMSPFEVSYLLNEATIIINSYNKSTSLDVMQIPTDREQKIFKQVMLAAEYM